MQDLLFNQSELPIPEPVEKQTFAVKVVKESRKAIKAMFEKLQMSIYDVLNRPLLKSDGKRGRKSKKRELEWDSSKEFLGSITITETRTDEDLSDVIPDWSSALLWNMHRGLFSESMEALKEEGNAEEKMDILEWIFSPNYVEKVGKSNLGRPCLIRRHTSDIPFSFVNCCRAMGIADHETFRELLVERMDDELRPKLEKYLQITQRKSTTIA